ncbi:MAG: hypothetical protein R3B40_02670 [Polyangiales bacterium]|nr:hypothetical protein [Myxococcales bacterium]MCB9657023.1 hypothetical protein [Sandaracinaceae bacterium]
MSITKSTLIRAGIVALGLSTLIPSGDAGAQRRRQRGQSAQASGSSRTTTRLSAAIAPSLDGLQWGWSRQRTLRFLREAIETEYEPMIRTAPGAIEEDNVRAEMGRAVRRIMDSYFEFDGTVSGHDSNNLRGEFTHNNQEAMMQRRTADADNYYFFIQNRLWKYYKQFLPSIVAGASFEDYGAQMIERFGPSRIQEGQLYEDIGRETRWYEWRDRTTRLRFIDNGHTYALVYEDLATVANLSTLRPVPPRRTNQGHALVDSVMVDPDAEVRDPHSDVADHISGTQRRSGQQE